MKISSIICILSICLLAQPLLAVGGTTVLQTTAGGATCVFGTHLSGDKKTCVANSVNCSTLTANSCERCGFWYWGVTSKSQGRYCENQWWWWLLIGLATLLVLVLLIAGLVMCCKRKSKKGYREMENELHLSGYDAYVGRN